MKQIKSSTLKYFLLIAVVVTIFFNQVMVSQIAKATGETDIFNSLANTFSGEDVKVEKSFGGSGDLSLVDIDSITSTAQGVAAIMPIDQIKTPEDAVAVMVPTGVPDYGAAMGVSFDEPVNSLATLANAQKTLLAGLTPEQKTRFITLASKPVGISCEYCCGVGPKGITDDGNSNSWLPAQSCLIKCNYVVDAEYRIY